MSHFDDFDTQIQCEEYYNEQDCADLYFEELYEDVYYDEEYVPDCDQDDDFFEDYFKYLTKKGLEEPRMLGPYSRRLVQR